MNPLKGETPLKAGEREFTLVLDHEALIEAEALYGKPLATVMAHAALGFVGAVRAMLYGALRAHHPEVTPKEASALTLEHMEAVGEALGQAAEAAFPQATEGKQGAHPPGPSSGANGAKRGSTRTGSSKSPPARSRSSSAAA